MSGIQKVSIFLQDLSRRLIGARRVMVVGNGGIALELIGSLTDVDVTWVLKHGHIGDAFFDVDAAEFLLQQLQHQRQAQKAAEPELEQRVGAAVQRQDTVASSQEAANDQLQGHENRPAQQAGPSHPGTSGAVDQEQRIAAPEEHDSLRAESWGAVAMGGAGCQAYLDMRNPNPREHPGLQPRTGILRRRRHRPQPRCPCCVQPGISLFPAQRHGHNGMWERDFLASSRDSDSSQVQPSAVRQPEAGQTSSTMQGQQQQQSTQPQQQHHGQDHDFRDAGLAAAASPMGEGANRMADAASPMGEGARRPGNSVSATAQTLPGAMGHAAGPRWTDALKQSKGLPSRVSIQYNALVDTILESSQLAEDVARHAG